MLGGNIGATMTSWAIRSLFSSDTAAQSQFQSTGAAGIDAAYLILAASAKNSDFSGLALYTPIRGTQTWGRPPQEFLGYSGVPRARNSDHDDNHDDDEGRRQC